MSVEQIVNASYHVSYNDTGENVAEVLLHEEHENNESSDQDDKSVDRPVAWIFENDKCRRNYQISGDGRIIQYQSSSNLISKIKQWIPFPPLRYQDDDTWIQHVTPLQPSRNSSNSLKIRVIDIGKSVMAYRNGGIEIGLASKLNTNRASPHQWKECGCHYNILNGGIFHRRAYPMEFVERGEPNDVIEWTISYANKDEGRVIKSAILRINGDIKGEPMIIENEDDLFPTLYISSSGAKVEFGYQDMHYSKKNKDPTCIDSFRAKCFSGSLKKAGNFLIPVFRLLHFLLSILHIADMISDITTTFKYYDYGINPNHFKSNHTNNTYIDIHSSSTTSTVEHSPYSNSFSYFYAACGIWASIPLQYINNVFLWQIGLLVPGYDLLEMMEEKFETIGLSATRFKKQSFIRKVILLFLSFPIIYLMASFWAYAISPMAMILIAFGNLFPKFGDKYFIKRIRNCSTFIKSCEAFYESVWQWLLAMYFYYYNKVDFDSPDPLMPWVTEGFSFRITIHLSLFSIITALSNFYHGSLTLSFGKDWWKLWKRPNILCLILPYISLPIILYLGLISIVIHVIYL